MVYEALKAADELSNNGIQASVDMHTIKPLDTKLIHSLAKHVELLLLLKTIV